MRLIEYTLILGFSLTGCGRAHTPIVSIDPGLQYQVSLFQNQAKDLSVYAPINDLILAFGSPADLGCGEGKAGCCWTQSGHTPRISIDINVWNQISDTQREILVSHELGHCILGRVHRDDFHARGVPASIMETEFSPYLPSFFESYKTEYYLELFGLGDGPEPFGP